MSHRRWSSAQLYYTWTLEYTLLWLVDLLQPYSFHPEMAKLNSYDYFYFSFVTMTTVGFGDILPQSPPAKSVIIFLSLIGQLYLTILVAVLVGQFLAKRQDQSE